ncbi:hypothetical protein ACFSM5_11615 [Lacibacterium aquatile]|uniref:TIGR02285 family protein n=1 Tax=Lacibacterium aquatile TaxID=1168082 RepID=A0ABW5DSD6_9PROT
MKINVRRGLFKCALLVALLAVSPQIAAEALPEITWIVPVFPPATIATAGGSVGGLGYADRALALVIQRTPEFDHKIQRVNLARFVLLAEKQDGICNPALLMTPDREQILVFSDPAYPTLGHRLITTAKGAEKIRPLLSKNGALKLDDLEALPDLMIGHGRTRVFGVEIDAFLRRMDERRLTYDVNSTSTAIRMLSLQRIDYTFATPVEAGYYLQQDDQSADTMLTSFAVEGVPHLMEGRFACSKGPIGHEMIARINALIPTAEFKKSWWPAYEGWLDENARRDATALVPTH